MSYDNTDSGVLFKNDSKERDNQPDYTGKINVGGVEKRLAAWIKQGRNGKFMSLKVTDLQPPQDSRQERQPNPARQEPLTKMDTALSDLDDEIPF